MPVLRRRPAERVVAWILTGPLGHFYGGAADALSLTFRWFAHARRDASSLSVR